jgi:heme-degrading monooxygenase HmoA
MKIFRIWHGSTSAENADAYEALLKTKILPGIHRIGGYGGSYLLRRPSGPEVEFVTITTWDSWEAIEEFAGSGRAGAVVPPEARRLLAHFDEHAEHFEASWIP